MKRVLLTGGSGFVGRNIVPILEESFCVFAPRRAELDLMDPDAVARYLDEHSIDVVVHSANPNPVKSGQFDSPDRMFEDSMRMFMSFYHARDVCDKVLYLGSGAEYDKRKPIVRIAEEEVHRSLPTDVYGLSKSIMNDLAQATDSVVNLRLFACFGPWDHESKFITHCIRSVLRGGDIVIRQNCLFDYLHVSDLGHVVAWAIDNDLAYRDYNVASGRANELVDIANMVLDVMRSSRKVIVTQGGMNNEYTASINRLDRESGLANGFLTLEEGIERQVRFEFELFGRGEFQ